MIRSPNNPQVRTLRRLRSAHGRKQADTVLLEGPHLTLAGAEAGLRFRHLLVTPEFEARQPETVRTIEDRSGVPATPIDAARLREQADADAPQGIAALAEPAPAWRAARTDETGVSLAPGLHLYVDRIQDPGNLGAMARSAEAAGAASLLLAEGSARPGQPRALRASAGSLLRMPVWTGVGPASIGPGACWLALTPHPTGTADPPATTLLAGSGPCDRLLARLEASDIVILAVGSESRGLAGPIVERADLLLSIPMAPRVESLNAAVAASLALFELRRLRDL